MGIKMSIASIISNSGCTMGSEGKATWHIPFSRFPGFSNRLATGNQPNQFGMVTHILFTNQLLEVPSQNGVFKLILMDEVNKPVGFIVSVL